MKATLYRRIDEAPPESEVEQRVQYLAGVEQEFFRSCSLQLEKINSFFKGGLIIV
jgi:hypothetical protein